MKIQVILRTEGQPEALVAEVEADAYSDLMDAMASAHTKLAHQFAAEAALGATDRNTAPRSCCYTGTGPCASCSNTGPVGPCCFPLWGVCPLHH